MTSPMTIAISADDARSARDLLRGSGYRFVVDGLSHSIYADDYGTADGELASDVGERMAAEGDVEPLLVEVDGEGRATIWEIDERGELGGHRDTVWCPRCARVGHRWCGGAL